MSRNRQCIGDAAVVGFLLKEMLQPPHHSHRVNRNCLNLRLVYLGVPLASTLCRHADVLRRTTCWFQATLAISAYGVRRAKAALSSGCKPHPATAPAGSNRSSHGGNEVAEAFD